MKRHYVMNPILKKELRIGSRTMKFPLSLMIYALGMAGAAAIVLMGGSAFNTTISYQTFTTAFPILTFIQLGMVCLIMPVLTAASISGEREKQTLDIMLTTPVSPMTIMLGKLLASLSQLMMFILCSIPAMAICFIYGGLNWIFMVQFFLQIFIIAFFVGSIGIWCSALFRKTITSIIMTMLLEAFIFLFPILLLLSVYQIKFGQLMGTNYYTSGIMVYMGILPAIVLFDPILGFIQSIVSVCYSTNVVAEIVLNGDTGNAIYKSATILKFLPEVWNYLYPVITIGFGFLFLYLAGRHIDRTRRANKRLSAGKEALHG